MNSVSQQTQLHRRKTGKGVQTMKGKMVVLGILMLVSALAITGCGGAGSALEPAPAEQSSRPSDPVGARDAVLAYLA